MSSATGNRSPRAGAHRAPRSGLSFRRAGKAGDGAARLPAGLRRVRTAADAEGATGSPVRVPWIRKARDGDGTTGLPVRVHRVRKARDEDGTTGLPVGLPRVRRARDGDGKAGVFGVSLRSRSTVARGAAVLVLAVIVGAGIANGGDSSAEPTVYQFLLDWEQGQYQQAAALTTGPPAAVATELRDVYDQLDATNLVLSMGNVTQQGATATAAFRASIDLGSTGLEWKYSGGFGMRRVGSAWRIIWSPSVIVPQLQAGDRLAVAQEVFSRGQLQSASGAPLTVPSWTEEIGVYPDRLRSPAEEQLIATRLADVFHLEAGQVEGEIEASPFEGFRELITLPPDQFTSAVQAQLAGVPGLQFEQVYQRLFDSIAPDVVGSVGTETAGVLRQDGAPYLPGTTVGLSGLQQAFQHELTGTPTVGVLLQGPRGQPIEFLPGALWLGQKERPVRTTLDSGIQLAANNALTQAPGSAAIVAVQAGTGKILAVASRQVPGWPSLNPLAGSYQPGQAFMIVSAAAILATGQVNAASPEQCWKRSGVNGRSFVNLPAEPAGLAVASTVGKDFAVGCSTAFAQLSELLHSGTQLDSAAAEFGIGVPWQLPLPTAGYNSGSLGRPSSQDEVAADAIGQGGVRVSALSMALAAAAADSGRWHPPSLVIGEADPSTAAKTVISAQVLQQLQGLMRDAVTHGSASAAEVGGSVYGQAGVAPFTKRGYWISWFVGYRGNVAFAVAQLVPSPVNSASQLAGSFLGDIHAGS